MSAEWQVRRSEPAQRARLAHADWPDPIPHLLALRGHDDPDAARLWLSGRSPQLPALPNLDRAVDRLAAACRNEEQVAVFGDYDADGITGTVIAAEALRALGARPLPYLPDRRSEGYGLNREAIGTLAERGASLLVSIDCGTSNGAEIAFAGECGLETIVLDHHSPGPELPEAYALVNPHLEPGCGAPAGCGIALLVTRALHEALDRPWDCADEHSALAAIGSVCDVVPLVDRERAVVRRGLRALRASVRPGLQALARAGRFTLAGADEETCGWRIGPRLNAAGRMAHPNLALRLLFSREAREAAALAARLEQLNAQRQAATRAALELARSLTEPDAPLHFVASEEIPAGIAGLVAGRLTEESGRPAIAVHLEGETGAGSCRAGASGVDISALLEAHADLFVRSGGHAQAGGFQIARERLPEAAQRLSAHCADALSRRPPDMTRWADAELQPQAVPPVLPPLLTRFGPHGAANPAPVFLGRSVQLQSARAVGDGSHLACRVRGADRSWQAIGFGLAAELPPQAPAVDVLYRFRYDEWQGGAGIELLTLRPATAGEEGRP